MLNKFIVAQEVRNRLHAEAQGRSDTKRRERNAPRRDDLARACVSACNFDPVRRGIGVQF